MWRSISSTWLPEVIKAKRKSKTQETQKIYPRNRLLLRNKLMIQIMKIIKNKMQGKSTSKWKVTKPQFKYWRKAWMRTS